jgi:hypothetical protein
LLLLCVPNEDLPRAHFSKFYGYGLLIKPSDDNKEQQISEAYVKIIKDNLKEHCQWKGGFVTIVPDKKFEVLVWQEGNRNDRGEL